MDNAGQLMGALVLIMAFVMAPRIAMDWMKLQELRGEMGWDGLQALYAAKKEWINRHFVCAFAALLIVVFIKCEPGLKRFDPLAGVTGVYVVMSLAFAFVESLFAQMIANELVTREAEIPTPANYDDF